MFSGPKRSVTSPVSSIFDKKCSAMLEIIKLIGNGQFYIVWAFDKLALVNHLQN